MSDPRYLVTAAEAAALSEITFRHPLNPRAEIHMRALSGLAGLERIGLTLARLPPGRDSFEFHFHHGDEEFLSVISGRGVAEIGDETFDVGPGDVMMVPAPSPGHNLRNPYEVDLVYLMGGERHAVEVAEFPRAGKQAVIDRNGFHFVDAAALKPFVSREA